MTGNNSTLQTTDAHETRKLSPDIPVWEQAMNLMNSTPIGKICDTPAEARMQVSVLLYIFAGFLLAGIMDSILY